MLSNLVKSSLKGSSSGNLCKRPSLAVTKLRNVPLIVPNWTRNEVAWVSRTRQHLILEVLRACITEEQDDETEWLEDEKTIKETSPTI